MGKKNREASTPEEDEYILSNSLKTGPLRCAARRLRFGAQVCIVLAADEYEHDGKHNKDDDNNS